VGVDVFKLPFQVACTKHVVSSMWPIRRLESQQEIYDVAITLHIFQNTGRLLELTQHIRDVKRHNSSRISFKISSEALELTARHCSNFVAGGPTSLLEVNIGSLK
jgi:hypothetical protein